MYDSNESWTPVIVGFGVVCGFIGWLVIEALIWLFTHVSISWGNS